MTPMKTKIVIVTTFLITLFGCGGIGSTPDAEVTDMPTEGPIGKVMHKNSEKFANCGRDSIAVQTGSIQKLRLKFMVDPEGKAKNVEILGQSGPDPDLQYCLSRIVKATKFPLPKSGNDTQVIYPLTLRPE